jgi:hypothetical protein
VNPDYLQIRVSRWQGLSLVLARIVWMSLFVLTVVIFCAELVVGNYGLVVSILLGINTSVWLAVGLVLFWRKSTDRAILLFSLSLVLTTGFFIPHYPGRLVNDGIWWIPIDFVTPLTGAALSLWYTFPDGRFVPVFTRWLAVLWIAAGLLPALIVGTAHPWNWWLSPGYTIIRSAFYGSLALVLFYRYRWVSTPVQRQQLKWVVFAGTIVIGEVSVASLLLKIPPSLVPGPEFFQLVRSVTAILPVLFPVAIGIALLRYRLWDIDRIINLSLVYALLTAILAVIYAALIITLQSLTRVLTGTAAKDPFVIVASTLVIAVVFQPLRRRIQHTIDRRFYRSAYDAVKVVAAFGTGLQSEVDLGQLREQLLGVVEETMHPEHVSLWLRQTDRHSANLAQHPELYGQKLPSPSMTEQERASEVLS